MSIRGSRRSNQGCILARLFAEDNRVFFRIPVHISSAECSGPFQLKVADKSSFHFQRLRSLDLEQNNRARFVHRHAQGFAHSKVVARIQNGCGLGTDSQRACEALGWKISIADMKSEVKLAKDLEWIDPGFKSSRFVAKQSRAGADDRKKLPGAN